MCGLLMTGIAACSDSDAKDEPTPPLPEGQLAQPQLTVANKDASSFIVSWAAVADATTYVFTVDNEAEQTTDKTQIVRVGLTANTEYTVKVKATAEGFTDSTWSTLTVKTDALAEEDAFEITVPESGLTAFSAQVLISPRDKEATYYCGVLPKDEYEIYASTQEIADELIEYMGELYPEYLSYFLSVDDLEGEMNTLPQTEYVAYAFNWTLDGTVSATAVTKNFITPAAVKSSLTFDISFSDVTESSFNIKLTPGTGIDTYYMMIAPTSDVDEFVTKNGEMALIGMLHSEDNEYESGGTMPLTGLSPETSYTVLVFALDQNGAYLFERKDQATTAEQIPERVESTLFTELLGTWTARQTFMDYNEQTQQEFENETVFDVTIVGSISGYDRDYRKFNQLVAKLDGYGGIPYYDIAGLIAVGFPEAQAKASFGPNLLLTISEGDVVTIDGKFRKVVYGWSQAGNAYMVSADYNKMVMDGENDIEVDVSEDKNTLTFRAPASLSGYYPTLVTLQGQPLIPGLSNLVMTRKGNAPQSRRIDVADSERARLQVGDLNSIKPSVGQGTLSRTSYAEKVLRKWNRLGR